MNVIKSTCITLSQASYVVTRLQWGSFVPRLRLLNKGMGLAHFARNPGLAEFIGKGSYFGFQNNNVSWEFAKISMHIGEMECLLGMKAH